MRDNTDPGISRFKRRVLFPILLAVVSLTVVELSLQGVRLVLNAGKLSNRQYLLSPYRGREWAEPLFRELLACRFQFDPFLGFRERPMRGAYVNIDADGIRKTWNPPSPPNPAAPLVLVVGGSTVWGWGARDDHTIPSYLSRFLFDRRRPARVVNCGQRGYTLSQEVLQLTRLLQHGARPQVAIFYDGFNDVFFAYRAGRAEAPFDLAEHARRFEAGDLELAGFSLIHWLETHSMILSISTKLASRLDPARRTRYGTRAPRYSDAELDTLAAQIADAYAGSADLLDHLAGAYGFRCERFWQPLMFYEPELTPEEARIGPAPGDRPTARLFIKVRQLLDARGLLHFHDITDVYRGHKTAVYTDFAHVSEAGNELVAARIGDILIEEGALEQAGDRP
jgi:lysophospholipase L1-like esterase